MPSLCAVLAWLLNQIDDSELISCTLCEQAKCFRGSTCEEEERNGSKAALSGREASDLRAH